jgi:hypothetical protein
LYMLSDYFKNYFIKSDFSPPQWGMVWGFVGSQVLGVYVHGFYFQSPIIMVINYVSIILAVIVYSMIFTKLLNANKIQVSKWQRM